MRIINKITHLRNFYLILFVISLLLTSSNIWGPDIYILDEAKNASCAREMFEKKDFIIPTFNYELRTDKPPLHYFFMFLSYLIFGVSTFSARFFSAIMGALTIVVTYHFVKKYLDRIKAFWTATILLSSIHFILEFHLSVPDPYLIFFFTCSVFLFYDYYKSSNKWSLTGFYASIALASLAKGPVAIGLPGLIIIIFLLTQKSFNWTTIKRFRPFTGGLLVLLVASPWYILAGLKTNWKWTQGFFLQHNLNRFTDTMEGHGGIFLLTPLFIFIGLMPFSLLIMKSLKKTWKLRTHSFVQIIAITALVITIFFSVSSTKLPNYPMPSYPFWAVLIALAIPKLRRLRIKKFAIGNILFGVLLSIGGYLALKAESELAGISYFSFFLLIISFGGIVSLIFVIDGKRTHALLSVSLAWMLSGLFIFYVIYPLVNKQNPVYKSKALLENTNTIAFYKRFNPAYAFEIKKELPGLNSLEEVREFVRQNKQAYVISTTDYREELLQLKELELCIESKDLFERPVTIVLRRK